jgi:3-hydroxymyristoyl/3-hydroxydecanoyl-(acyl carrier protein) dehydratase
MGFILVDRIAARGPVRATGCLELPEGMDAAPACMAAEAVGQLAAWIAMERSDFRRRPVAGLAGRVAAPGRPPAARLLELEVDIESLDESAVIYSGRALASGSEAVRLERCLGPMLPIEEFEDPGRARSLHAELVGSGRSAGRESPPEFPRAALRRIESDGGSARAEIEAFPEAAIYADHFPRRAVFPGTLLLDAILRLAEPLAAAALRPADAGPSRVTVSDAKMRSFVEPGAILELEARILSAEGSTARLRLSARGAGRLVAGAQAELAFEAAP